ncbi:MAG: GNAT family N-acetyltransferase [Rhodospirillaceae bacterium]
MLERLKRQIRDVRSKGVAFTLRKLFANHVYGCRTTIFLRGPGPVPAFLARRQRQDLELRPYGDSDAWRFRRYLSDHLTVLPDIRSDGADVWMLLDEAGDAIAFVCSASTPYYDRHVYKYTYVPPPGGFYLFSLMVAPEFRSFGGVGASVMVALFSRLSERGRLDCVTTINQTNRASMRLMKTLGFRETGEIMHTYRLLGLRWSRTFKAQPASVPGTGAPDAVGGGRAP